MSCKGTYYMQYPVDKCMNISAQTALKSTRTCFTCFQLHYNNTTIITHKAGESLDSLTCYMVHVQCTYLCIKNNYRKGKYSTCTVHDVSVKRAQDQDLTQPTVAGSEHPHFCTTSSGPVPP